MKSLYLIFVLFVLSFPNYGQSIQLPIVPIIAEYEFAPHYLSQTFNHPQYSTIEAIIDEDKQPVLQIILTETESKKRVFYTNSKIKAESLKNDGKEAYLIEIDFKQTQEVNQQPTFEFALRDKNGLPIIWRVIYASQPSERGAGLTLFNQVAGLKIDYRDLGTTVGEGTAIQIGDKVFEAEYWKERSSPPFFMAYRGSVTIGRHIGALLLGTEKWNVQSQPKELKKGEKWILITENGRKRILEIADLSKDQNELIVQEDSQNFAQSRLNHLVILINPQGYSLRYLEIKSKSSEMRIRFENPIPIYANDSADFESEFIIGQGKNKKVVSGKIIGTNQKDSYTKLIWHFSEPDWAKKKTLESMIKFETKGYSIETKEVTK